MYIRSDANLKKSIGDDINGILSDLIDVQNECKYDGVYVGKVVDNNDPEKLGRCRIYVFGVMGDSLPIDVLPWAVPEFDFVGSLKGSFIVPPVDTLVRVTFEHNEINLPKYSTKVLNINQLPTNKDKNYPNNMIFFETDNGDSFEIDRDTSETTFIHNTGTTLTISPDGSVTIDSAANITTNHADTLIVKGNKVEPLGVGPLNAIRICPFSGALHNGMSCSSLSTFDPEGSDIDRESLDAFL